MSDRWPQCYHKRLLYRNENVHCQSHLKLTIIMLLFELFNFFLDPSSIRNSDKWCPWRDFGFKYDFLPSAYMESLCSLCKCKWLIWVKCHESGSWASVHSPSEVALPSYWLLHHTDCCFILDCISHHPLHWSHNCHNHTLHWSHICPQSLAALPSLCVLFSFCTV